MRRIATVGMREAPRQFRRGASRVCSVTASMQQLAVLRVQSRLVCRLGHTPLQLLEGVFVLA